MSTTYENIITSYDVRGGAQFVAAHAQMAAAADQADRSIAGMNKGIMTMGDIQSIGTGALVAIGAAATALAVGINSASEAGAKLDSAQRALKAVEGSARGAEAAFMDLRDIAKAPGIAFEESLGAYTQLKRVLGDGEFAKDLIREFGNMNALAGGTAESFDRIVRAVQQIATKPFLQGEELLQLTEAGVPAYKIMQDAFGTTDTESLKAKGVGSEQVLLAILAELKKAPRVDGGAMNSRENFAQSLELGLAEIGMGINTSLAGIANDFSTGIDKLIDNGSLDEVGQAFASAITAAFGDIAGDFDSLALTMMNVASYMEVYANSVKASADTMQNIFEWATSPVTAMAGLLPSNGDPEVHLSESNQEIIRMRRYIEERKRERAAVQKIDSEETKPSASKLQSASEPDPVFNQIRRSVRSANLQRGIIGGGELGRFGVTAEEIGRARSNEKPTVTVQGSRELEEGVRQIALSLISDLMKQGMFGR
jgi:tape measure domain-containing protein